MSSSGPGPRVLSHLLFLSSSFLSPQRCVQSWNGWSQFSQIVGSLELVVASQPCGVSLILRLGTGSIVGEGGLEAKLLLISTIDGASYKMLYFY